MQVDDDAPASEVRQAYRNLAKVCHPDQSGDEGHELCILLNEVRMRCHNMPIWCTAVSRMTPTHPG